MYSLGHVAEIISIFNVAMGMYMAHSLHKTPKKLWQCIVTWVIIFAVCTAIGEVLNVLLPQYTEQRLSTFTGCLFIFGYLYLFPNIPMPQRIFNYFFAIDVMYMLLLASRTSSMLLVGYFNLPSDLCFALCYFVFAGAYLLLYLKWFKKAIQRGLAAFQKSLISLTTFSILCFFGSVFITDVWKPWHALNLHSALPYFGLLAVNLGGYVLAFRTLAVTGRQLSAEAEAQMSRLQLGLAEKEYKSTMQGIDQVRRMRHDMKHHLNALAALISQNDMEGAREYIAKADTLLPQKTFSDSNIITSSFIERYRELCVEEDIKFSADMSFDEEKIQNKTHLGIILGNSLQNAFDAAKNAEGDKRFISIEGKQLYDNFVLVVKNGFAGELSPQLASTKGEGHGIGISSMNSVVRSYKGFLDTSFEAGVFTLKIVLAVNQ
ncbi:MAG: GHKL domain-containing protein [Oscillospiraceae bacterium]